MWNVMANPAPAGYSCATVQADRHVSPRQQALSAGKYPVMLYLIILCWRAGDVVGCNFTGGFYVLRLERCHTGDTADPGGDAPGGIFDIILLMSIYCLLPDRI
jgi:hypothetical protein